ncbi:MAG: MmcQ/YjbR family DNA-binding protein [Clostridium sp.]|nr:MmcQ/YjbR family DNA-binding protein [Clostridium sp.]
MDIESVRTYCLAKPFVTEDFPFDEVHLVFRLKNKIFACVNLNHPDMLTLKCDADYAVELRDRYDCITGAFHWNKKYWNQLPIGSDELPDSLIRSLIEHAYDEIVKKLPRKQREELLAG